MAQLPDNLSDMKKKYFEAQTGRTDLSLPKLYRLYLRMRLGLI